MGDLQVTTKFGTNLWEQALHFVSYSFEFPAVHPEARAVSLRAVEHLGHTFSTSMLRFGYSESSKPSPSSFCLAMAAVTLNFCFLDVADWLSLFFDLALLNLEDIADEREPLAFFIRALLFFAALPCSEPEPPVVDEACSDILSIEYSLPASLPVKLSLLLSLLLVLLASRSAEEP